VTVIEVWVGGRDAFVAPVSEFHIGDNAQLTYATYQRLDTNSNSNSYTNVNRNANKYTNIDGY